MAAKRKKTSRRPMAVRESEPSYGTFKRITFHPSVMAGQACIRGMRIPVSLVVNLVANGMSPDVIIHEYPDLEREDIAESLRYAAWLTRDEVHASHK